MRDATRGRKRERERERAPVVGSGLRCGLRRKEGEQKRSTSPRSPSFQCKLRPDNWWLSGRRVSVALGSRTYTRARTYAYTYSSRGETREWGEITGRDAAPFRLERSAGERRCAIARLASGRTKGASRDTFRACFWQMAGFRVRRACACASRLRCSITIPSE